MRFRVRVRPSAGLAEFNARLRAAGVLLDGDGSDGEWVIQAKTVEEAQAWMERLPPTEIQVEQLPIADQ